jgi:hypothetical protein
VLDSVSTEKLYVQGLLGVDGYHDGAVWDMTSVPFQSATAGCGIAVAGDCPNCSASLLLFSPDHNAFIVDHASQSWTAEMSSLMNGGGSLSALASWSMAGRLFVGATVSISNSEKVGWNWTSPASENIVESDALAIFEFLKANRTLVRSSGYFALTQLASSTAGALIGPVAGTAGRASYSTLSSCNVSVLIVPSNASSIAYQILPVV